MSVLLIVGAVVSAVLLFLLWTYSYWYRRGIPQGNPLKLLGDSNDITLTRTPYWQLHLDLGRKFADKPYYGAYSLGKPRLFIRDPEMVKDVLTRKFSSFSENGFAMSEDLDPIVGRDPFFQKGGERWKESRAHFSSIMTPARLRGAILPEILVVSEEAVSYIKEHKDESGKGDGTNSKDLSLRYMINILIRISLSLDANCFKDENSPFLVQARHFFSFGIESIFATLFMLFAPTLSALLGQSFLSKDVKDFFSNVIQEQKRYRKENEVIRDDILNLITKRANDTKSQKSESDSSKVKPIDADLEVLALIIMFFLEGFETSATTLSATFASLAKHEDIQENLRREILKSCPLGKEITEDAINNFSLLANCVSESLRLYPPAVVMQRVVTEDITLTSKAGEELPLKKGEYLHIPIAALHKDPEYFPDPESFDPHRFEDEIQKRNLFSFGDGPRQCPGQKFAGLAIKVLLIAVLREFKLELSPKTQYPLKPINNPMIFALKDVRVRFVPL